MRHRIAWLDSTIVTDPTNLYMYDKICGRSMNMYRRVDFLLTYKKLSKSERYALRFEPSAQSRTHLSSLMRVVHPSPDAIVSSQREHRAVERRSCLLGSDRYHGTKEIYEIFMTT